MPNINFEYLYRDGSNGKNYADVVFANPDNIDLQKASAIIHTHLIDQTYICAHQWRLKNLFFGVFDDAIDHTWHGFVAITPTGAPATELMTVKEFLAGVG
jgi:hypothetical protein